MQHSPHDIKEKLLRALDKDNNVVDMVAVSEVIAILEKTQITKDELEKTRLGKYINELRKKTTNEILAKRAKDLVRKWRSEMNIVANGEHHHNSGSSLSNLSPLISHLPGPGPGHGPSPISRGGWGTKPASPAFLNHHHHRGGGSGALTETSPGNSQCSSASVSPPVFSNTSRSSVSCGHSITPTTSRLSVITPDGHFPGFKPISPAPSSVAALGNSFGKFPSSRSVNITSPATTTNSRSSPIAYKSRTLFAGSKRPRPDDEDSCDSHGRWDFHGPANSSLSPPTARFGNGVVDMGDSMDSARSCGESVDECNASRDSSLGGRTSMVAISSTSGKRGRGPSKRPEKCDHLKEKLASHLKTPKVKTTAELIQELKAKNSGSAATVRSSPQGSGAGGVEDRLRVPSTQTMVDEASLAYTRKVVYSSLLGTDEDITRNKTELMEKFLNDSAGSDGSPTPEIRSKDIRAMMKMESLHGTGLNDPAQEILASLPPLNVDEIVWSDVEGENEKEIVVNSDNDETDKQCEVAEDTIIRLHTTDWECMNGNYDYKGDFQRWNEMLTRESGPDNTLHLLPYVDTD